MAQVNDGARAIPPSQTVESALHLLDVVATYESTTLTEISQVVRMTISKTHRLLTTLERSGYLVRGPGKTYQLGPKLLYLGHRSARGNPLLRAAAPTLDSLSEASGETALLAIRFGTDRLIVDSRDSRYGPQAAWPYDARLPLNSGALGICLLSYASEEVISNLLKVGLTSYTSTTVATEAALREALMLVRQHGFYLSKDTYLQGVFSIASPVLGGARDVVAAISIVGDVARLTSEKESEYAQLVRQGASDVSRYLA